MLRKILPIEKETCDFESTQRNTIKYTPGSICVDVGLNLLFIQPDLELTRLVHMNYRHTPPKIGPFEYYLSPGETSWGEVVFPREGKLWNFGGTHETHEQFLTGSTGSTWVEKDSDGRDSVVRIHVNLF